MRINDNLNNNDKDDLKKYINIARMNLMNMTYAENEYQLNISYQKAIININKAKQLMNKIINKYK